MGGFYFLCTLHLSPNVKKVSIYYFYLQFYRWGIYHKYPSLPFIGHRGSIVFIQILLELIYFTFSTYELKNFVKKKKQHVS